MLPSISSLSSKLDNLQRLAKAVEEAEGKSRFQQFADIAVLLKVNPTCSLWDYYRLGLYRYERGGNNFRKTMGDGMYEQLSRCLNHRSDVSVAWDKLLFDVFCHAYDIPCAKTIGLFIHKGQAPKHISYQLNSEQDIKAFLAESPMPIFAKPVSCRAGYGGFLIKGYCMETHQVTNNRGEKMPFTDFMNKTVDLPKRYNYDRGRGYLFQRFIKQHPLVNDFTGTTIPSGLRIMVLNAKNNPIVYRSFWKITRPGSEKDNFSDGANGNLLSQVNILDGSVSTGIDAMLPQGSYHTHHPHTGEAFASFKIPNWDKIVDEVKRASQAAGEMKLQHWDVMIGPDGPVFLELNEEGGVGAFQLHGSPFVTNQFKAFLKQHGNFTGHTKLKKIAYSSK